MEKYTEIIKALECCHADGGGICVVCPYKGTSGNGMSCRQKLCLDAMEALAAEEVRADEAETLRDRMGTALNKMSASNACLIIERDRLEECRAKLQKENEELREELKNRPEVGFDANTFDACLGRINEKTGAAEYWRGYAEALEWVFREITFANQEAGDDV